MFRLAFGSGGRAHARRSKRFRWGHIEKMRVNAKQRLKRKRCFARRPAISVHVTVYGHSLAPDTLGNRMHRPAAVERLPDQSRALAKIFARRFSLKQHERHYVSNLIRMQENTSALRAISGNVGQ